MDIRDLELFLHLADSLHFSRTGELMHMSPSAVSRSVQRMEAQLGCRLLERDKRQVRLTEAGRRFRDYARGAHLQWEALQAELQSDGRQLHGEISLYCSVTAAYSVLSVLLQAFRNRHPGIELKVHTGGYEDAIERVQAGDEDLAVAARPERLPAKLRFLTLSHTPLLFIAPNVPSTAAELLAQADTDPPWAQLPFVMSERGLARQQLDQWLRQQGIRPRIYAQVSGHEAIVSMVGLGLGVGVVPELVLINSPQREQVRVLDVSPPLAPFAIGLCAPAQRLENPLVRAFWDCARSCYRPTMAPA